MALPPGVLKAFLEKKGKAKGKKGKPGEKAASVMNKKGKKDAKKKKGAPHPGKEPMKGKMPWGKY